MYHGLGDPQGIVIEEEKILYIDDEKRIPKTVVKSIVENKFDLHKCTNQVYESSNIFIPF